MRRYTLLDQDVPMAFYRFYIYFRMPLSVIRFLMQWSENGITNLFSFTLSAFEILLYVCACIGLWKMKHWGYVCNKIFLIFELILFSVLIPLNMYFQDYAAIGTCVAQILINIPILIYFEKRKFLFGAPFKKQKTTVEQPLQESDLAERSKEILISHTCTNCRGSFKVRFKPSNDHTEIPNLSVVCPFCNTTEIIKKKKKRITPFIFILLSVFAISIGIGTIYYNQEYKANQLYAKADSQIVYVTKSGTKYHKKSCNYLKNSSIELTRIEAEKQHYSPCSKCRPDRIK